MRPALLAAISFLPLAGWVAMLVWVLAEWKRESWMTWTDKLPVAVLLGVGLVPVALCALTEFGIF